jgi:hypothetical protein
MTVEELISGLQKIPNKKIPVLIYDISDNLHNGREPIDNIDYLEISVDLNINTDRGEE